MELKLKFFTGKKGNVISRLPNGKIVLPNFSPIPGEEYLVEVEEKGRYAVARLHQHKFYVIVNYEPPYSFVFRECKCGYFELIEKTTEPIETVIKKYKPVNADEILQNLKKLENLRKQYHEKLQHYLAIFKTIPTPPKINRIEWTEWVEGEGTKVPVGAKIISEYEKEVMTWSELRAGDVYAGSTLVDEGEHVAVPEGSKKVKVYRYTYPIKRSKIENLNEIQKWFDGLTAEQKYAITWLDVFSNTDENNEYALECAIDEITCGNITQTEEKLTSYSNPVILAQVVLLLKQKYG
ncbi:hypothetical protein DRO51_01485 [Candidatus Bathyarchaeota archaeon]|nr:MAG: hypothetical protein DRO51_01485 [Candidatus Bathyarchaeota archaeon]